MQIIFQDPYGSLNPRMRVGAIVAEGIEIHGLARGAEKRERVLEMLRLVGLREDTFDRYPHEFSGGQRQRICIARALAVGPQFLVADEPVSALDVSIQSQVLNLFKVLQEEFHLTCLFIAHDLSVVEFISDHIAVLYLGKIVEMAPSQVLYTSSRHPYTRSLLSAIPLPDPEIEKSKPPFSLTGETTSPIDPPPGCRFFSRCPVRRDICEKKDPDLVEVAKDHYVACFSEGSERKG